jgi:hypothetical protein
MAAGVVYVHVNVNGAARKGETVKLNAMTSLWARTALVWFLATIGLGLVMGMRQLFNYAPVHAHMGVLGWLSAALFAVLYALTRPGADRALAPRLHWAAHNLGVATMTLALFMELTRPGGPWGPLIAVGAVIIVAAAVLFVTMMWSRLAYAPEAAE